MIYLHRNNNVWMSSNNGLKSMRLPKTHGISTTFCSSSAEQENSICQRLLRCSQTTWHIEMTMILITSSKIINSLWNQRLLKVIQEGIAELIRLEDQFILRDQDMSSQMEFGLFAHKKNYGNLIINHMRFFRSKSLWRAHMCSRNKFSILFLFWIWLILVFPRWVKKCVD